jgi:hypothetical protein
VMQLRTGERAAQTGLVTMPYTVKSELKIHSIALRCSSMMEKYYFYVHMSNPTVI